MHLTPREKDKLLMAMAAEVARRRLARGVRLNHPEAVALISDHVVEGARDGRSVADLMSDGATVLTSGQVMPGVAAMIPEIQVEATFPDGVKLVTVHQPIRAGAAGGDWADAERGGELGDGDDAADLLPGEILVADGEIVLNADRDAIELVVANTGDRPVQVGSHYHFAEANPALDFDRAAARGHRLDIAAGTAVRFEPGQSREVRLVPFGGARRVTGFRGEVMGALG